MNNKNSHLVYISLGSNQGDRLANFREAMRALPPAVIPLSCSPIYQTPPWGFTDQPDFLNQVIKAQTTLSPQELLAHLKEVEVQLGRQPTFRYGPRLIDLDILFYDELMFDSEGLVIPHPRLQERAFVLLPLSDLAPELRHPVLGKTVAELLNQVSREGIRVYSEERMHSMNSSVVDHLMASSEPTVRYKLSVNVLGLGPDTPQAQVLRQEIRFSPVVRVLLSEQGTDGKIPHHPYSKWLGAHWVLASLADLGYPPGDESLKPLLEQSYGWLLSPFHLKSIRTLNSRARRCASQEGNLLYYGCALGFADDRSQELTKRLARWQWPDGGWNCDKRPEAVNSSYMESLIPMRGLAIYARLSGDPGAARAVERVAEIFLKRELFKRQSDGSIIHDDFVKLHYPPYWHYDILFGLKVMAEAGLIGDPRCQPALDLLESKRLPDGGFPAEGKYYHHAEKPTSGRSRVDWGGTSKRFLNEFVTVDALSVLKSAGRLRL